MRVKKQWWLNLTSPIVGFDEGGSGEGAGESGDGQGTGQGAQGEGQGSTRGQGEGNSTGETAKTGEDVSGLKSALTNERNQRKALEKELKEFRDAKKAKDDQDKTDVQRLTDDNGAMSAKLQKLANGYRDSAIEAAVMKAATAAKFRDPSDALRHEVLRDLPYEQDEDDPTKVTIDTDELTRRVKALATAKPHYVDAVGNQQRQTTKSGSTFSGGSKGSGGDRAAELSSKYPALRGL